MHTVKRKLWNVFVISYPQHTSEPARRGINFRAGRLNLNKTANTTTELCLQGSVSGKETNKNVYIKTTSWILFPVGSLTGHFLSYWQIQEDTFILTTRTLSLVIVLCDLVSKEHSMQASHRQQETSTKRWHLFLTQPLLFCAISGVRVLHSSQKEHSSTPVISDTK